MSDEYKEEMEQKLHEAEQLSDQLRTIHEAEMELLSFQMANDAMVNHVVRGFANLIQQLQNGSEYMDDEIRAAMWLMTSPWYLNEIRRASKLGWDEGHVAAGGPNFSPNNPYLHR